MNARSKPPKIHLNLLKALDRVDRPGVVSVSGDRPMLMPGLVVKELGPLGLPLGEIQAHELIDLCHQAPYGKGVETLVDKDVRNTWELDADQIEFTNPKWQALVADVVAESQQQLGLEDHKLIAHPYKLLVYEPGGFFLPHRDGEKLDRMVATLVIGLPSVYSGGELIVTHGGRSHEIVFTGAMSGYELSYAAFYADCEHEIRPLKNGYRLCMTYNLTLADSRRKKGIAAPAYGSAVNTIARLLTDWRAGSEAGRLAILLEHRYTEDGLRPDTLKGNDRSQAEVLFEAAEQADCMAWLVMVTLWKSGGTEDGGYGYYGSDDYHWSEDSGADYHEVCGRYEMDEVFDGSLSADHWSDQEGEQAGFGKIILDETEIVAATALEDTLPSEEDYEGYTGNAGMTLERWYRRAAIVIWPRDKHFEMLCDAGTDAATEGLQSLMQKLKAAPKKLREKWHQEGLEFATAIIDHWQPERSHYPGDRDGQKGGRKVFPELLVVLDDPERVRRFLKGVMPDDGSVQLKAPYRRFFKQHGWASFASELGAVIEASSAKTFNRNADLLSLLCRQRDKNPARIALCTELVDQAVTVLELFDSEPPKNRWMRSTVDRFGLLVALVDAMLSINADKPLVRLVDHVLEQPEHYDLTDVQLPAILKLKPRLSSLSSPSPGITEWLNTCRENLEGLSREAPKKPTDYRRENTLGCHCKDCQPLAIFLADPDKKQARFPLAKARRQHLHQKIDRGRIDLTHVTERQGRPYTLVCTKTTASWEEAVKIYKRDKRNLAKLQALGYVGLTVAQ